MSTVPTPACTACLAGDHAHCRNWVDRQGDLDYCQCFWRNHVLIP